MPLPKPINLTEDVVPFTTFRASLASYIAQTRRTHRPILVTQNGKSSAILLDATDFDAMLETFAIVGDVRAAEAELDRGEGLSTAEVEAFLRAEGLL